MVNRPPHARPLTQAQRTQFTEAGYLSRVPLFGADGVARLKRRFEELKTLLPEGTEIARVNCWHKCNAWVYELCRTPTLLDRVEELLGPDFYLWGAQFFCKFPGDGTIVPWHQDAQYWPFSPRRSVTAWIAVFDTDTSNAAMRIIPGSHRQGDVAHHEVGGAQYMLPQEVDAGAINESEAVSLDLAAGEMSLHDDGLIHGSGPNLSDRVRAGLVLRYSAMDVRCDLSEWPTFESYPVRGDATRCQNPIGRVPMVDGFPTGAHQHSSEFP